MKKYCFILVLLLCAFQYSYAQVQEPDTTKKINLGEVVVAANKLPILLKNNTSSVTLVNSDFLKLMPKSIGAEEALRLVPGVRVDNQHDGERVHLSIRGQGILTERGLRGIGVLIDGIPVNDPSGFAPDLYDVDWATVNKIEVMRGPVAGLYGGGGAAGVINISTNNGGSKSIGGQVSQAIGSNGFYKSFVQLDGTKDVVDYRVSYSRTGGDGYRDHQGFWSNKLYEKVNFHFSPKLTVTQIYSHTDYFQQNPEGLNLGQFDNLLQANPDACPFNEYQKTSRTTAGLHADYKLADNQNVEVGSYLRSWNYKETSNRCAEYRTITNPGVNAQYNLNFNIAAVKNKIGVGADFKWQDINMYKLQSTSNPNRVESLDETNLETSNLLANQIISQRSSGIFAMYNLAYDKFNVLANVRYDKLVNQLTDKMLGGDTASISKNFASTSVRVGASYNFADALSVFANISQGFIPPSTEELASNPTGYSGFNTHLVPATSNSFEVGVRGLLFDKLNYELTGFSMKTKNDFFRFKQLGRGNQEVFYGNAGNSDRKGVEVSVSYQILKNLNAQLAYTYADYKYTTATIDPVYTDPAYVLTNPPAAGQWLPNSPRHQLSTQISYSITKNLKITVGTDTQSKWAIYTDAKAYSGQLDPSIYQNWQEGFTLLNAGVSYDWSLFGLNGVISLSGRNLTGEKYMAFTEPDPDGNSYQPAPSTEVFGSLKIRF